MKKDSGSHAAFFKSRVLVAAGIILVLLSLSVNTIPSAVAAGPKQGPVTFGTSIHNDVSPALRDMPAMPLQAREQHEAMENPPIVINHEDAPDTVIDKGTLPSQLSPNIPLPILNFAGIPYPGVHCSCAPPDPNGEVGATQYVQMVNEGYQVFDKITGSSILGPNTIESLWSGFGGLCQFSGSGDPVVVYDQIANRWVITEIAGSSIPTEFCVAVSTTSDATGTYNRYDFHLNSNFNDYPKIAVWPDAYYISVNLFDSSGTVYLGPQATAFDRTKMLAGQPATFVSMPALGTDQPPMLPSDLDGKESPGAGAPNSYVLFPSSGKYNLYHFHVDFVNPLNSTFTLFASPDAAPFTLLCPGNRNCVPQRRANAENGLDAIADRPMFRLAYRKFRDGHESLVGNYTVSSRGVAGIRWFELRGVTAGPVTVFQESTYQPDKHWRWLGSAAMDKFGNLAIGFSTSDFTIFPQIRYAGRLATDPLNTLGQGEAHLYDGTGSQLETASRWGDYSDLTVDPVDDHTFYYTNEYYDTISTFNWRTRIGSFKF